MAPQALPGRWKGTEPALFHRAWDLSADGKLLALAFSRDRIAADELGRVVLIGLETGKIRWQFETVESAPASVRISPDGRMLAVGTTRVTMLNADSGARMATFEGHRGAVTALAFRPDGRVLASGGADSTVVLWSCPAE